MKLDLLQSYQDELTKEEALHNEDIFEPENVDERNNIKKRFHCDACGLQCNTLFNLKQHKRIQHLQESHENFTCEFCGLVLSSTFNLHRHQKLHTEGSTRKKVDLLVSCDHCE